MTIMANSTSLDTKGERVIIHYYYYHHHHYLLEDSLLRSTTMVLMAIIMTTLLLGRGKRSITTCTTGQPSSLLMEGLHHCSSGLIPVATSVRDGIAVLKWAYFPPPPLMVLESPATKH